MLNLLNSEEYHIWDLPFHFDPFEEDNDTSEEEEDEEPVYKVVDGEKRQQVVIMEGHGLEFFINQEKVYLGKKLAKHKLRETNTKALEKMLEACGSVKANKFLEGHKTNLALDDNCLNCIEYV